MVAQPHILPVLLRFPGFEGATPLRDAGARSALVRVAVEIFKKTFCFPGLKPAGRDVAQDTQHFGNIPLLNATKLDHDDPQRDLRAAAEPSSIMESTKAVQKPTQDARRSADVSTTPGRGIGRLGIPAHRAGATHQAGISNRSIVAGAADVQRAHESQCDADI